MGGVAVDVLACPACQVDAHGYVQGVCGAPSFDKPGRAAEGQAFFLLMEAAHSRLAARRSC